MRDDDDESLRCGRRRGKEEPLRAPETRTVVAAEQRTAMSSGGLFFSVREYPQFRRLWGASFATQLGQWFQAVALGWLALDLTNRPAFVGQVAFMTGLPMLLLSLPAGVLLDRVDRRRALLAAQLGTAALALAFAGIVAGGWARPWLLLVAAPIAGALQAFSQPATQALVPTLVPREDLPNALALSSAGNGSTRIIGPSLAGLAIGAIGLAGCFAIQAGALLIAFAFTMLIRTECRASRTTFVSTGGGLLDGLRVIRRDRAMTGLLLLAAVPAFLAFPYIQMLPVFARDTLRIGSRGLGFLLAASGVGAVAGALVVAALGRRADRGRLLIGSGLVYGLLLTAFALSPWPLVSGVILICSGFIGSIYFSLNTILLQLRASDESRGRVLGALALTFGLTPIGALPIGELAQRAGAPWAVTTGALLTSLLIGLLARRYREVMTL